jgi:rhodanese-related sulfurtransferase
MKELSQKDWSAQLNEDENSLLLDVRTDEEFSEGYIPNAKQLDIFKAQEFVEEVNNLDKSKNFYVYCRSGKRSAQACQILNQLGVENTYNLEGGFMEWQGKKETL